MSSNRRYLNLLLGTEIKSKPNLFDSGNYVELHKHYFTYKLDLKLSAEHIIIFIANVQIE